MQGKTKKEELSNRQIEVLTLLRRGLTNGEICRTLNISENTAKTHIANIYRILEVTNRAEAAAIDLDKEVTPAKSSHKHDIVVAFEMNDNLQQSPQAHSIVYAIIEALHQYHLFKIRIGNSNEVNNGTDYQIKVAVTHGTSDSLFVTLYQDDSASLLWSYLQKVEANEDIKVTAVRIAIQIFRYMETSAAEKFAESVDFRLSWWYASCFAAIKMENRNKELFTKCESILRSIIDSQNDNIYPAFTLVNVYYTGIVEHWVEAVPYTEKIGKLACEAMRDTPYSAYAQFMMALYNILIGNKSDAIAYFVQILETNPQDVMARRYLTQIYLLVGKPNEALYQQEQNSLYVPEANQQPFQLFARSFIYLLQGDFDKCELISKQILMIHPDSPIARLFMVACNNRKGNQEEALRHKQKFRELHPNFKKSDIEHLLNGVTDYQKEGILSLLGNLD